MKMRYTVIGSYPKPSYLTIPNWFKSGTTSYIPYEIESTQNFECHRAIKELVNLDIELDVLTDGEMQRENYILYHCRHLKGIDFKCLENKIFRNGAYQGLTPVIRKQIKSYEHFLAKDFLLASSFTEKPIKVTLPGPMTILDTLKNEAYENDIDAMMDIARALNCEILDLVRNGCKYIQIDEPVMARYPNIALEFGHKLLETIMNNVSNIYCILHICCGYPDCLDSINYHKADHDSYFRLAPLIDSCLVIDCISIEDAHCHNDLTLFSHFKRVDVCVGVVNSFISRIESIEEIQNRIKDILKYIPTERLWISPDCGLGMLTPEIAKAKLQNMVLAGKRIF